MVNGCMDKSTPGTHHKSVMFSDPVYTTLIFQTHNLWIVRSKETILGWCCQVPGPRAKEQCDPPRDFLRENTLVFGGNALLLGEYTLILRANRVVFWANTVVFEANSGVFGPKFKFGSNKMILRSNVFKAHTVVFGENTVAFD